MSDRGNDKPAASASANNPYAEAHAKALYKDRESARNFQSFLPPESPEWREVQEKIDAIDRLLRKLGKPPQIAVGHSHKKRKPVRRLQKTGIVSKRSPGNREAFLRQKLRENSLSVNDWANKAGVDPHTANDYVKGKNKPFPSTLEKLARPLGLKAEQLPK